jgi:L-rhamnose mutarotase
MAALAADPTTRRWWELTDAMQGPLADRQPGAWWTTLTEVFHTD